MFLNQKKKTTNTHVRTQFQHASQLRQRNTSGITGCVLQQPNPQRQTTYTMPHRQHGSVENPENYSSLQWKLSVYQNSGRLPDNFNRKHDNNGSKIPKGPYLWPFRVESYYRQSHKQGTEHFWVKEDIKWKELVEAIFKESKLHYYWDQERKDKLTWPLC